MSKKQGQCRHQCDCADPSVVAMQVLCRVFSDGADAFSQEWLSWYNPKDWLHWSRALGAFIYQRLTTHAVAHSAAFATAQRTVAVMAQALHNQHRNAYPSLPWDNEPEPIKWMWRDRAVEILNMIAMPQPPAKEVDPGPWVFTVETAATVGNPSVTVVRWPDPEDQG